MTPVADADVWADSYDCCGGGNGTHTDADGTYTIQGLASGDYRVMVRAQGFAGELYNDTRDWEQAARVSVTAGATTPTIDFTLEVGGSISGTVYEADGVTPIEGIALRAEDSVTGSFAGWARSEDGGSYTLFGLPPGEYIISAFDDQGRAYVEEYYNNVPDSASATAVAVVAGADTAGIDFTLDAAP